MHFKPSYPEPCYDSPMNKQIRRMAYTVLFIAVNYAAFTFGKINIPLAAGQTTAIHIANAVVVLSAWLLGPYYGGLAGAVGLSLADLLDPLYISSAPKTFFLKFMIGFIAGKTAERLKLSETEENAEITKKAAVSAAAALFFNVLADPVIGYLYKHYLLNLETSAAKIVQTWVAGVSSINAVICLFIAVILYRMLYKQFRKISRSIKDDPA